MKIGELATMAHTSVETIRFYEKTGLMPEPDRTANNYRVYGQAHLDRLRFIRNCRMLDLSHEEIWALLKLEDEPNCVPGAHEILDEHIAHVHNRILELQNLEKKLKALNVRCSATETSCGVLRTLTTQEIGEDVPSIPNTHAKHDYSH